MEKKQLDKDPEADDKVEEDENYIPTPPDGGWGWMVTLASFFCNFIVDGIGYAFGVLLPKFAEHFGESKGKVSLIGSLLFGIYLCSGPITSGLVNRFGCRAVTITGSLVASLGFLLGSFAPNLDILILTYGVLGGFGFGMIYLPSIVSVGFYFEKRRALATGIAMCGSGVGTFVFSPLNDFLLELYGWRSLLLLQAGIILNTAVCGMLMRPLTVTPEKSTKRNASRHKRVKELIEGGRPRSNSEDHEKPNEKQLLVQLLAKDDISISPKGGIRSLPVVHFISKDEQNGNTDKNKNTGTPLIVREIVPRTHHSRADSHPTIPSLKEEFSRPMYRKDIFYSGSLRHIPQFLSQPDMRSYIASITSIPGISVPEESSIWDKCTCLPKTITDIFKEMLNFSLMLKLSFFMIFMGNLFACTGFFIPFSYIVDQAEMLGFQSSKAAFLLSIMGISNTIGRVLSGFLADLSFVNPLLLNNVMLLVSAVALCLEPFCTSYTLLVVFSAVYGLCIAAYISLTSPIICDWLGIEKLSNAFGLITLARGISGIYGPPLAGAVYQYTKNYDASFYLGGGMYLLGAICHLVLHLPCVKKTQESREYRVE